MHIQLHAPVYRANKAPFWHQSFWAPRVVTYMGHVISEAHTWKGRLKRHSVRINHIQGVDVTCVETDKLVLTIQRYITCSQSRARNY